MLNNQGYLSQSSYIQQIIQFISVVRKLGRDKRYQLIHFKHPHLYKHWTRRTRDGNKVDRGFDIKLTIE